MSLFDEEATLIDAAVRTVCIATTTAVGNILGQIAFDLLIPTVGPGWARLLTAALVPGVDPACLSPTCVNATGASVTGPGNPGVAGAAVANTPPTGGHSAEYESALLGSAFVDVSAGHPINTGPKTLPPEPSAAALAALPASASAATIVDALLADGIGPAGVRQHVDRVCTSLLTYTKALAATGALFSSPAMVLQEHVGMWRTKGFPSYVHSFGKESGVGQAAGRKQVQISETIHDNPQLQTELANDTVTPEHVAAIGRAKQAAAKSDAGPLTSTEQTNLINLAKTHDAGELNKLTAKILADRDPISADDAHEAMRRRRSLVISGREGGLTRITGTLDPESGRILRTALQAATYKPTIDDDRSPEQRTADALVDIAALVLDRGFMKNHGIVRPHVSLIVTAEQMAAYTAFKAAHPHGPIRAEDDDEVGQRTEHWLAAAGMATFDDDTSVTLTGLGHILCDAAMTRIVMDAGNQPINVGRTERLFTHAQRRAIAARDHTCREINCSRPAGWCEYHHMTWDSHNGATDMDNALLMCRVHHLDIHRGILTVIRDAEGAYVAVPANRTSEAIAINDGTGFRAALRAHRAEHAQHAPHVDRAEEAQHESAWAADPPQRGDPPHPRRATAPHTHATLFGDG